MLASMNRKNAVTLENEIVDLLDLPSSSVALVGSTLIHGSGNDVDFLIYVPGGMMGVFRERLSAREFAPDLEHHIEYEGAGFTSWRRGDVNLIVTTSERFFASEVTIAHAAVMMSDTLPQAFQTREDRIAYHSTLRKMVGFYNKGADKQ